MKYLIIDNYDSFTYNIVQLVRRITGKEPDVRRNDCFEIDELSGYDKILLSPGPGIPSEAGRLMEVIRRYGSTKSILGICLGHQAIGEVFGALLVRMTDVRHGIASELKCCTDDRMLRGLPQNIEAGHYHSWTLSRQDFPDVLEVVMEDQAGNIMAIRHREYDIRGLQFHPESVLTPEGEKIVANWINSTNE
jgi:anthranilate synthase component 2